MGAKYYFVGTKRYFAETKKLRMGTEYYFERSKHDIKERKSNTWDQNIILREQNDGLIKRTNILCESEK